MDPTAIHQQLIFKARMEGPGPLLIRELASHKKLYEERPFFRKDVTTGSMEEDINGPTNLTWYLREMRCVMGNLMHPLNIKTATAMSSSSSSTSSSSLFLPPNPMILHTFGEEGRRFIRSCIPVPIPQSDREFEIHFPTYCYSYGDDADYFLWDEIALFCGRFCGSEADKVLGLDLSVWLGLCMAASHSHHIARKLLYRSDVTFEAKMVILKGCCAGTAESYIYNGIVPELIRRLPFLSPETQPLASFATLISIPPGHTDFDMSMYLRRYFDHNGNTAYPASEVLQVLDHQQQNQQQQQPWLPHATPFIPKIIDRLLQQSDEVPLDVDQMNLLQRLAQLLHTHGTSLGFFGVGVFAFCNGSCGEQIKPSFHWLHDSGNLHPDSVAWKLLLHILARVLLLPEVHSLLHLKYMKL